MEQSVSVVDDPLSCVALCVFNSPGSMIYLLLKEEDEAASNN